MNVGGATIIRTDVTGPAESLARQVVNAANNGGIHATALGGGLTLTFGNAIEALSCVKRIQMANELNEVGPLGSVGVSTDEYEDGAKIANLLCSVAESGQVLVTDRVRSLVVGRGGDDLREVGRLALPGGNVSVRTWELLWREPEPRTRVRLCGVLALEIDGHELNGGPPTGQAGDLLCYLLTNRERPISRSELIEVLWPKHPPKDPFADLRPLLSRLRRALGPERLEGKYQLKVAFPTPVWVDVEEAARAIKAARLAARNSDWDEVRGRSMHTLELLQPGFLPGHDWDWLEARRRELEELELEALEWAARSSIVLGGAELATAERAGREMITRSPYRETGYRCLIEALAAGGNVAEALRVYEGLRRLLRNELGVAPAAELQTLHQRLLVGDTRGRDSRIGTDLGPL